MTLNNINVRFFGYAMVPDSYEGWETDIVEIDESTFLDLQMKYQPIIEYDRSTVFDNGVDQVTLTMQCDVETGEAI